MTEVILREPMLRALADDAWDVLVIGGGATGFACAMDAASRGYRTALVERGDFGQGTSSRSTKLIHGGVRYLRQGHIGLVRESLRERRWFLERAPHVVHPLEFVIPCTRWGDAPFYRFGLSGYDWFAATPRKHRSRILSRDDVLAAVPGCRPHGLRGGVRYTDGQFDDARMLVCFFRTVLGLGGVALNYVQVQRLLHDAGRVAGAVVRDEESGVEFPVRARAVINATGVFTDEVCRLDDPSASTRIAVSQGIHLVLSGSVLGGATALMIPKTEDGRVLFAIPWQGKTLLGTTDTLLPGPVADPRPLEEEIDYLLRYGQTIFAHPVTRDYVSGMFAGLRPLAAPSRRQPSAKISRDFSVETAGSGLVSVFGGKWTTCRCMGAAAVDRAAAVAGLPVRPSATETIALHGGARHDPRWPGYGTDGEILHQWGKENPHSLRRLHPDLPLTEGQLRFAVRYELARTAEDVLARRSRCLFLDATAAQSITCRVTERIREEQSR